MAESFLAVNVTVITSLESHVYSSATAASHHRPFYSKSSQHSTHLSCSIHNPSPVFQYNPSPMIFTNNGFLQTDVNSLYHHTIHRLKEQTLRGLEKQPYSPLHRLLPPKRSKPYLTRGRVHNYVLPSKTTTLDECHFVCRLLYKVCL